MKTIVLLKKWNGWPKGATLPVDDNIADQLCKGGRTATAKISKHDEKEEIADAQAEATEEDK